MQITHLFLVFFLLLFQGRRIGVGRGLGVGPHLEDGHVQVLVQPDHAGRRKGQGEKVGEREPVPVLGEDQHTHHRLHVGVTGARLEGDGDVPSAGVDDSLGQDGAELSHNVLVLLPDELGVHGPEALDLGTSRLRVLDQDERRSDQRTLADVVDRVVGHGFDEGQGLSGTGSSASDAQSHGRSVPDVGIVGFGEQRDDAWTLFRSLEEQESQTHDSCPSDVIIDIGDSHVQ